MADSDPELEELDEDLDEVLPVSGRARKKLAFGTGAITVAHKETTPEEEGNGQDEPFQPLEEELEHMQPGDFILCEYEKKYVYACEVEERHNAGGFFVNGLKNVDQDGDNAVMFKYADDFHVVEAAQVLRRLPQPAKKGSGARMDPIVFIFEENIPVFEKN